MKLYHWILASLVSNTVTAALAFITFQLTGKDWLAGLMALLVLVVSSAIFAKFFYRQIFIFLQTVELALLHFKDGEFSLRLPTQKNHQLQHIANLLHQVADSFRVERSSLLQRELLLDRVFSTVSSALLLTDGREKVVLCNPAARQLLSHGKAIKGAALSNLLPHLPLPLAEAIEKHEDGLFSLDGQEGEPEIWHLSCENFSLNGQQHCLYHFKQMTRTLSRSEVDTWKKVIRVLSHELNNSLGPISSLAHSGKQLLARLPLPEAETNMLAQIFSTLSESATHLTQFLSGYAQFTRLPKPQPHDIHWLNFLTSLQNLVTFQWSELLPLRAGFADAGQLSHVLINLIKNATEAGAPPETISLHISAQGDWDKITLSDGGSGMSDEQLKQAMLPFYSTKRDGTGLGLALCREIVDAHGGRIKLANGKDGGLVVTIWLPAKK